MAYQILGIYLCVTGRFEESLSAYGRAHELDPLSLAINEHQGWPLYYSRRYDPAVERFRQTLEMEPNFHNTRFRLGLTYAQKGMYEEAAAELRRALGASDDRDTLAWLGYVCAVTGSPEQARDVLEELRERSRREYVSPYDYAAVHIGLGEKDRAFEWLARGAREHDYWLIFLRVDPLLDPLRADPRFRELERMVGLP